MFFVENVIQNTQESVDLKFNTPINVAQNIESDDLDDSIDSGNTDTVIAHLTRKSFETN